MSFRELLRFDLSCWWVQRCLKVGVRRRVDLGWRRQWRLGEIQIPEPTGGKDCVGVAGKENGEATELLQGI
jgi:hypothetical protein